MGCSDLLGSPLISVKDAHEHHPQIYGHDTTTTTSRTRDDEDINLEEGRKEGDNTMAMAELCRIIAFLVALNPTNSMPSVVRSLEHDEHSVSELTCAHTHCLLLTRESSLLLLPGNNKTNTP